MKILIFYASYGGGHLNAAKSIHECLKNDYKDKNINVELIDCMKYVNKTIEKMTTKAYNEMAKKAPWAWGRIYSDAQRGPLAHITSRSNKIMAIKGENKDVTITISGDAASSYGSVIGLMAMLKDAGFSKVGLKTEARRDKK